MPDTKKLKRFLAEPSADGARLTLEVDGGERFVADATFEQLEDAADTLDEILSANDDALEVRDEENA